MSDQSTPRSHGPDDAVPDEPVQPASQELAGETGSEQDPPDDQNLDRLRHDVEAASRLPVAERLAAFEAINVALVDELAQLDEL